MLSGRRDMAEELSRIRNEFISQNVDLHIKWCEFTNKIIYNNMNYIIVGLLMMEQYLMLMSQR